MAAAARTCSLWHMCACVHMAAAASARVCLRRLCVLFAACLCDFVSCVCVRVCVCGCVCACQCACQCVCASVC
jgi:hypothetical protein